MENNDQTLIGKSGTRPVFLSTLCVFSFIGGGLWFLFSLIGAFTSESMIRFFLDLATKPTVDNAAQYMDTSQNEMMKGMAKAMTDMIVDELNPRVIISFIGSSALALVSVFGVLKMWKLKKSGFWIYSFINGLLAFSAIWGANSVANGSASAAIINIWAWIFTCITTLFIVLYGLNLKHMK